MMKKILLGTTAIVGTALLAGPALAAGPELGMSGNVKFEASFVDQDPITATTSSYTRGYKFSTDDAEIVFKAKATADNGLEYGAKIEYEFENEGTDEAMIWLEGDWGTINLGTEDGAEDAMKVGGFSLLTAAGGYDGENFFTNSSGAIVGPGSVGDSGDANKITYYSPSMSGFRVGASYTPDLGAENDDQLSDDDGDQETNFGVAAEYKGDFDQVGVHASVRYMTANYESN
ncbi:MAG: porin, partial [Rhodospirillales bacterium]|nr:porin [Rhodospirillales bacterium]